MSQYIKLEDALPLLERIVDKNVRAARRQYIPKIKIEKGIGDEEEAVLLFSDLQYGVKTPSTNMNIISNRVVKLAEALVKIITIQRSAIPINKLNIFMMGDMIQSEDILWKVDLDALECVINKQMFEGAIPATEKFLLTVAPYFPGGIDVWCVPGNHGNLGRMNAVTTNWDTIIYKILKALTANYPEIRWHIEDEKFYQIVNIMGTKFMVVHGDCIPRYLNIPVYGITQRLMRWQGSIEAFDVLCMGHFHTPINMDWNQAEYLVNGTFVSDDQWALKVIGMATTPKQILFGVHPRKGISFYYKLKLNGKKEK